MLAGRESSALSAKPLESATLDGLYDRDFVFWCEETARLLRARRLSEIDIENTAEEIESMARGDKRQMRSRLRVLILHLLKWERQPDKRKLGWEKTMATQRREIEDLLEESPSLRPTLGELIAKVYRTAVEQAAEETRLPASAFPPECPYTPEQIMDRSFLPATRRSG